MTIKTNKFIGGISKSMRERVEKKFNFLEDYNLLINHENDIFQLNIQFLDRKGKSYTLTEKDKDFKACVDLLKDKVKNIYNDKKYNKKKEKLSKNLVEE